MRRGRPRNYQHYFLSDESSSVIPFECFIWDSLLVWHKCQASTFTYQPVAPRACYCYFITDKCNRYPTVYISHLCIWFQLNFAYATIQVQQLGIPETWTNLTQLHASLAAQDSRYPVHMTHSTHTHTHTNSPALILLRLRGRNAFCCVRIIPQAAHNEFCTPDSS